MRRPFLLAVSIAFASGAVVAAAERLPAPDSAFRALDLFATVFQRVESDYVEPVTDQKLVEGAVSGMLSSLDPHSSYLNADQYREMQVQTDGKFAGIGAEVTQKAGRTEIVTPIDDTPAARAGLKPGDVILRIGTTPTSELTLTDVAQQLRGQPDTDVTLTIQRGSGQPFDITLTRKVVQINPVKSRMAADGVGYARIAQFNAETDKDLRAALDELSRQAGGHLKGLVLDLRNDPGGLLSQAVAVAGDFLDGGAVVSTHGRRQEDDHSYEAKAGGDRLPGVPIVVLINGGTASAAEIVAGALQDRHRAVLLGTTSFGKGSVQTIIPLGAGEGAMRLTTARYYTPSGRSIQGKGIEPDIVVEQAKIERIAAAGPVIHEADLRNALKNPDDKKTADDKAGAAPAAAAAKPEPAPGEAGDYQLARAVDLLEGVAHFAALPHSG
jgi:carboxyl-terminal processing protease